jgi:SNF2 family DNA or RNA helicase
MLKPWQLTGVGKLQHLFNSRFKGGILGDEQGLGKSLTTIAAMVDDIVTNKGKAYRGFNLIVTTKSCAPQWISEINRHYGSVSQRMPMVPTCF